MHVSETFIYKVLLINRLVTKFVIKNKDDD